LALAVDARHATKIDQLDVEGTNAGRGVEHIGLQLDGHVPSALTRSSGVDDEQQAAALTALRLGQEIGDALAGELFDHDSKPLSRVRRSYARHSAPHSLMKRTSAG